jgi:hypothetical protein
MSLHDATNFDVNVPHFFWSASDTAIRVSRFGHVKGLDDPPRKLDRTFESQNIELRFRTDFALLVSFEIPLAVPKQVIQGSIDCIDNQTVREYVLPLFDADFWINSSNKCGAHDIASILEIYDDAFLLRFCADGQLCWYDKWNAIVLSDDGALIGIGHRFRDTCKRDELVRAI